ncbi:MAG: FHA domain-containing protein [Acidimicrobiia bacterium]
MPEQLLNVLKLCLLVLLYLFFVRVARAVWVEVNGPRLRTAKGRSTAPAAVGAAPPAAGRRGSKSAGRPKRSRSAGGARPGLVVMAPAEVSGRRYDLAEELTMGRAAGCQITLDDTYVSQVHARVFVRDGVVFVEDLGSTNGTYLNRKKVAGPLMLKPGDQVQVGSTVLELVA